MDFFRGDNRSAAPQPAAHQPSKKSKRSNWRSVMVVVVGILIILGLAYWLSGGKNSESSYINGDQYQAVFLTNNQVYFGKITELNKKFVVLKDVYYIETPSQTQASTNQSTSNYTLRKLGSSELHLPEDQMIINREQVTFWENIKDTSQVVTKIREYQSNPSGSSQNSNPSASEQPAESTPSQ